jgi:hypothetical protein
MAATITVAASYTTSGGTIAGSIAMHNPHASVLHEALLRRSVRASKPVRPAIWEMPDQWLSCRRYRSPPPVGRRKRDRCPTHRSPAAPSREDRRQD